MEKIMETYHDKSLLIKLQSLQISLVNKRQTP